MAEVQAKSQRQMLIRHRGRGAQVRIYLGKMLRMFIYQNDWKVLPMAALIAGLVGMVIRKRMFLTMEGTLMGAFAMVCVCIWNGCFNSIQVICRERDVIKREHRSGMHISSYIVSHMLYQALLCLAQTVVTLYVTQLVGVQYPWDGLVTPLFPLDFMISMFLITYASDMMSLWVSALAKNTTTAMTIMPFVLIFQLVFSGGMLSLPSWTETLTHFTISNPGLKVIAAQADTNNRPYDSIASMVSKMGDSEIGGTFTVGQILDILQAEDKPIVAELRAKELGKVMTLGELKTALESSATFDTLKNEPLLEGFTVADVLIAMDTSGLLDKYGDTQIVGNFTIGEAVDFLASNPDVQSRRDQEISVHTTVGKLLDLAGADRVKAFLEEKAAAVNYNPDYDCTEENITAYWLRLATFVVVFALLSMITLEFIDKDKR